MEQRMDTSGIAARNRIWLGIGAVVLFAAGLGAVFRDGIWLMIQWWAKPEYQHGYLIPLVSLYLVWAKADELRATPTSPSSWGVFVILIGLLGFALGELSAIYTIVQYAFLLTFWGVALTFLGWRGVRVIWAGLFYLAFMIPLPSFFQFNLSNLFQLWSSELGTSFLRLVGISVFLEGNVIDLGTYKLQVVEACSGLRYLFPLTSFGFFCAYIFRGPLWQKVVIFASAAPITILMNSFRIAVTGILVNSYGTAQAEGFLHYFEGWVIFVACIALLFLEMGVFALLSKRRLAEVFEVEIPDLGDFRYLVGWAGLRAPIAAGALLLTAGVAGSFAIQNRAETIPGHAPLGTFPLVLGEWRGREGPPLDKDVLNELKLSDYVVVDYRTAADPRPVDLYVAYYDSQRKGASVHSPRACLPSGGWQIVDFDQREVPDVRADGSALTVNRAVIEKGSGKAVVYYWFMQRGRYLTNEFVVKWFIFWDSLTRNRTDGAMVRVMMSIDDLSQVEAADEHIAQLIRAAEPRLYYHIPQDVAVAAAGAEPGAGQLP